MEFFISECFHIFTVKSLLCYFSVLPNWPALPLHFIRSIWTTSQIYLISNYSIFVASATLILRIGLDPSSLFKSLAEFLILFMFYKLFSFSCDFDSVLRVANLGVVGLDFALESGKDDFLLVLFKVVDFEILFHSWILIWELRSFSDDIKKNKKTLARALGRYESYKMFTLLQILFYSLVLLDCLKGNYRKSIILMLIPWTCYFVFLIRNMRMETLSVNYLAFVLVSSFILIFLP